VEWPSSACESQPECDLPTVRFSPAGSVRFTSAANSYFSSSPQMIYQGPETTTVRNKFLGRSRAYACSAELRGLDARTGGEASPPLHRRAMVLVWRVRSIPQEQG
jgi:hypothetical protein